MTSTRARTASLRSHRALAATACLFVAPPATANVIDYEAFTHRQVRLEIPGLLARSIARIGPTAFVTADENGTPEFHVVDLGDPTSPTIIGDLEMSAREVGALSEVCAVVTDTGFGVHFVDASDPTAPVIASSVPVPGGARRIDVDPTSGTVAGLVNGGDLYVITDVANCGATAQAFVTDVGGPAVIAVRGDHAYLGFSDLLTIVDITDPGGAGIVEVGSVAFSGFPLDIDVDGDRVVIANLFAGVDVFDVSDPSAPVRTGGTSSLAGTVIAIDDDIVYLHDTGQGIFIFDLATLEGLARDSDTSRGYLDADGTIAEMDLDGNGLVTVGGSSAGGRLDAIARGFDATPAPLSTLDGDFNGDADVDNADFVAIANPITGVVTTLDLDPSGTLTPIASATVPGAESVYWTPHQEVFVKVGDLLHVMDPLTGATQNLGSMGTYSGVDRAADGSYLFGRNGGSVDLIETQPGAFTPRGTVSTAAVSHARSVDGSLCYLTDSSSGIVYRFPFSNPDAPGATEVVATFSEPASSLWQSGDLTAAPSATSADLNLFRPGFGSATLNAPINIGAIVANASRVDTRRSSNGRDIAYLFDAEVLLVVDVTDLAAPRVIGEFAEPGFRPTQVIVADDKLVVLDASGRILVLPAQDAGPVVPVEPDPHVSSPIGDRVLAAARPNPFGASTRLPLHLDGRRHVRAGVYQASGRLVRELVDAELSGGEHALVWDGRDADGRRVGQGVYFIRVETGAGSWVRRVVASR